MCYACRYNSDIAVEKWTNAVANLNNINASIDEMTHNLELFQHLDKKIDRFRRKTIKLKNELNKEYQRIHND